MGGEDDRVLEVAAAIADGTPLDWDLDKVRGDDLAELRIISEIAALHRRLPEQTDVTMSAGELSGRRARPDLSNAERWGPLLLLDRVGGGGFGEVYRAWDPALDHEVALKLLRLPPRASSPDQDPTDTISSSIVREGQLLARVRHPNVITVHGALEAGGQVGIWMDFLHGRTLEQVVRDEGPMSAAEATIIGDSLCRAIAAVHRVGLLHRDIKASNVMREAGGRIVLLDFGAGSELTMASTPAGKRRIAGTPLYLAPELFEGAGPSVQSDIYSLGVLLFYLVTGAHPVSGKSIEDILAAHRAGDRALLSDLRPDLPRTFIAVVERALSHEPADRYASVGAMLRELTATTLPPRASKHEMAATSIMPWAMSAAVAVVGGLLLATILGYFTSAMFNLHLGITGDFASEGPIAYAALGAQNLVPTFFYMGVAVLLFYAVSAVVDLTIATVPALRRLVQRQAEAWRSALRRLSLDDANTRAKLVCAGGAVIFAAILWGFRRLLVAITSRIDVAPLETLSILHPSNENMHDLYGLSLDMLLLMLLLALFRLLRAGTGRPAIGPVLGMVALAGLALLFHAGAWRILYRNEFRQAAFEDQMCYVLGRNMDELLVHCPHSAVPRNRVVNQTDARLKFTGRVEQVSSAFAALSPQTPR